MKKSFYIILVSFYTLSAQIDFDVEFTPYVSYYLSVVDINTGESNVPIFLAELQRTSSAPGTVLVDLEYEIIIDSDALGVHNETLVKIKTTDPLVLTAPINLSNMDINLSTAQIFDTNANPVSLRFTIDEKIELAKAHQMFSVIAQTGRLPNGIYTFRVLATTESGQVIERENVLNINNTSTLQLISPGGALSDIEANEVYTSFPVFQWESDLCNIPGGCEYFIRLAEFNPNEFSSVEQAIEATTRLPLDQGSGYESVGFDALSYQYPAVNAGDLEPGKIYVWQIKKVLPTTIGNEELLSDILAFKIAGGECASESSDNLTPTNMALISLIGENLFNGIFGDDGEAECFTLTDKITLNNETVDLALIQSLITNGIAVVDSLGNESYRPIEILSVEVSQ